MKNELRYAEKIKNEYTYHPSEKTNVEKLKELDNKVKRPAKIISYIYGGIGSLILGTGMCVCMGVIGGLMPFGIIIGLAGIGMVSTSYPIHNKILRARKAKYSNEVVKLSNEIIEVSDYTPDKEQTTNNVIVSGYDRTEGKYTDNIKER